MRIVLLYPPPWKIPSPGEEYDICGDGPPHGWDPEKAFDGDEVTIPYGLLSLAAQARNLGHHVILLNLYTFVWEEVKRIIEAFSADLYGLSCFTSNRRGTISVSKLIRTAHPKAFIVIGGPHATALAREMLEHCEAIDGLVTGEGEATFSELIHRLEAREAVEGIPGLVVRTRDSIEFGPPRKNIKYLDVLISPYVYYEGHVLITSRGCPGDCTFCGSSVMWGKKIRFHSAEYILDTMERLVKGYKRKMLTLKDDTFTVHRKRILEICEGIRKRDLNFLWSCDTRVDYLDEELLRAMRSAGCQRISIGVESASPHILKNIRKRITMEQVMSATEMVKKYGFQIRYYMMAGNREESEETLKRSIDFIIMAKPTEYVFCYLTLYPGTREFEIAEHQGIISREDFFTKDFHTFSYFSGEDSPGCREFRKWLNSRMGVNHFWDFGVEDRERILSFFPTLHSAHLDMGGACYHSGRLEEAERLVKEAVRLNYPMPGLGYNYLACISAQRRDLKGCLSYLDQARRSGLHQVVEENLQSVKEWLLSEGRENGKSLQLKARHEFESFRMERQPVVPGPVRLHMNNETGRVSFDAQDPGGGLEQGEGSAPEFEDAFLKAARIMRLMGKKEKWLQLLTEAEKRMATALCQDEHENQGKTFWRRRPQGTKRALLLASENGMVFHNCADGFREMGWDVSCELFGDHRHEESDAHERLALKIRSLAPDLVLSINQVGCDLEGYILSSIKAASIPSAIWYVDNPFALLPGGDGTMVRDATLLACFDASYVKRLQQVTGVPSVHLPHGTNPRRFHPPSSTPSQPEWDITFVGSLSLDMAKRQIRALEKEVPLFVGFVSEMAEKLSESKVETIEDFFTRLAPSFGIDWDHLPAHLREKMRIASETGASAKRRLVIVLALKDLGIRVIGGPEWGDYLASDRVLPPVDYLTGLCRIFQKSRINLNISRLQLRSGVNQRIFDVPASGGFLLTDRTRELENYLEPDQEVAVYEDDQEATDKSAYYLSHEGERIEIAERARKRVLQEHTFAHRMRKIAACLGMN